MTNEREVADLTNRYKLLASMSLSLCHVQELVGMAYQLSCELHPSDTADAILQTSGRLATLLYLSTQQLVSVQSDTQALTKSLMPSLATLPPSTQGH